MLTGLDRLIRDHLGDLRGRRLGLLCHQASLTRELVPAWKALRQVLPRELRLLFAPQHGLWAERQANMVASGDGREPETGLPVVSLYGPRLAPEPNHLDGLDLLLVDLQDVGCRVYTYVWTLLLTMEVCARAGVEVWVLDRPNPLGRRTEGPVLERDLASFVGLEPLPLRHGLTLGELALYFRAKRGLDLALRVVPLKGWSPASLFPETGLVWVPPSPNMPRFTTALVYPGQVLLEGTNLSEGRGTTRPFEVFGAPWLRPGEVLSLLPPLPGVVLRQVVFEPWADKWAGRRCRGFQLLVTEPHRFRPVATTLALLSAVRRTHGEFDFRRPPYEFEWRRLPFDIIVGQGSVRQLLGREEPWFEVWREDLAAFEEETLPFRLYRDAFQEP